MSDNILDLIDNAIEAHERWPDAMRWTPDAPYPRSEDHVHSTGLLEAIAQELPRMGEELSRLFDVPVWMVTAPPCPRDPSLMLMLRDEFRRAYLNDEVPSGLSRESNDGSSERPTGEQA